MTNGNLPLTDETLQLSRTKHPEMQSAHEEVLLQGSIKQVNLVIKYCFKNKGWLWPIRG